MRRTVTGAHLAADTTHSASDARVERMDKVAVLYAEITAATRAFLAALAESDRHRDWEEGGFGSCAEWLAWRIGITRNTANEKVRAALALEHLPLIAGAMARGEISFSKVRALTRAATAENEADLLAFARAGSAAHLERVVRGFKDLSRSDERNRERIRHGTRHLSVFADDDGMYVVRGRLTPEVGAMLMRAIEAASDALFSSECTAAGEHGTEPRQRRADAVGLLAERALAAGFGATSSGSGSGARDPDDVGDRDQDDAPISGSRAERYQVTLHVEAATLRQDGEPRRSELEDGTRLSAETARRLACDASRVTIRHDRGGAGNHGGDGDGAILGVGRRTRTVPPALRRALEARDRGCRFPACGLRFTDAHHILHWADGGETKLSNLVLLCRRHHRRVHEEGFRVCSDRDGSVIVFFTPAGEAMAACPPSPALGPDPTASLVRGNRSRGVAPDTDGLKQIWRRDQDLPWPLLAAAMEALDPPVQATDENVLTRAMKETAEEALDPPVQATDETALDPEAEAEVEEAAA